MLNDLVSALELGGKKVEEERKKLAKLREEARKRVNILKENRDRYIKKVEERCESLVHGLEAEIEQIHKEIEKKERSAAKVAKEQLRVLKQRVVKSPAVSGEIVRDVRAGDYVVVRSLGTKGYVLELDKEGDMCEVQIGNIRTRVHRGQLERTAVERKTLSRTGVTVNAQAVREAELNLIGMHVEEALEELDRFIDRAILQGTARVKILHGVGTGRLMTAVKEHLHDVNHVRLKKDERNAGVTVVELS